MSQINIVPKRLLRSMENTTKLVLFTASSENPLLRESDDGLIPGETKMNFTHTEEDVDHLKPSGPPAREIDFDVSTLTHKY